MKFIVSALIAVACLIEVAYSNGQSYKNPVLTTGNRRIVLSDELLAGGSFGNVNGQQARQPAYTANRNGGERIVFQDNLRQQIIGYGQSEGIKNGNNPISGRPQEQGESFFPDQKPVTKFAWNLFTAINNGNNENYVVCPLSPQILLSYLASAAARTTKQEIVNAIEYNGPKQLTKLTAEMLRSTSFRELQIASAFFVASDLTLDENYLQKSVESNVDVLNVNFRNVQETSRVASRWINDKTKGSLNNAQFRFPPNTRMSLTSAVYFKSGWIYSFPPATPGIFYPTPGQSVPASMMSLKKKLNWGQIENVCSWIALPYNSSDSMVIMLPNENISVDRLIAVLSPFDIENLMSAIESDQSYANVHLTLPKFRIETSLSLVGPLQKMGVRNLFGQNAELPYLSRTEPLQVSNAQQQTILEVNEQGSIATSVTSFNVVALSYQPPVPDVEFNVNRPFVAMIVNREKYFPYFIAKVTNPSAIR